MPGITSGWCDVSSYNGVPLTSRKGALAGPATFWNSFKSLLQPVPIGGAVMLRMGLFSLNEEFVCSKAPLDRERGRVRQRRVTYDLYIEQRVMQYSLWHTCSYQNTFIQLAVMGFSRGEVGRTCAPHNTHSVMETSSLHLLCALSLSITPPLRTQRASMVMEALELTLHVISVHRPVHSG